MKKTNVGLALLCCGAVVLSGCFGSFKLTSKLYNWNNSFSDKWGREAIFLVTGVFLPIYGLAALGDAIVFNSIEFWSGNNPIAGRDKETKLVSADGKQAVLTLSRAEHRLRIDVFDRGRPERTVIVARSADGTTVARGPDGALLGTAETLPDNTVVVRDARGRIVETR